MNDIPTSTKRMERVKIECCPECNGCGMYDALVKLLPIVASTDIQKRYDDYNKFFWGEQQ